MQYEEITMNKILNSFHIQLLCILFFLFFTNTLNAQDTLLNKSELTVIKSKKDYYLSIKNNESKQMVDIKKLIPPLSLDLRYTSKNNFTKQQLYPLLTTTYLRRKAAFALKKVQQELTTKGLGLKIFDAYRPYSVTKKMWELVKDERYAASPSKGSGHNRGIAVDLTLINLKTKKELDMGTGFDNFSDTAHLDFSKLSPDILKNRLLLKTTMEKHGFKVLETEWWHYSLGDGKEFELLDIDFDELKKWNSEKQ